MKCVSCNYQHDEAFCPNCGEKSGVPKITFRSILNEGFSTITNMDKGFLYNVKNLFLDPQRLIVDYINGRRKGILNPVSFLIITVTVYILFENLSVTEPQKINVRDSVFYKIGYESGVFIESHFKYFWITSIVWLSLSSKLFFRRYSYAEHLAINSFVIGQSTLVGLLFLIIKKISLFHNPLMYASIFFIAYKIYKKQERKLDVLLQSLGSVIFFLIQLYLIVIVIGVLRYYLAK